MSTIISSGNSRLCKQMIGVCAFLACVTPRFIATFKIHIGMSISFFTVISILTFIFFCREIVFFKSIESWFFVLWFVLVIASLFYSKSIGDWLYYFVWIVTCIIFLQLLYTKAGRDSYEYIVDAIVLALIIHILIGLYEVTFHTHLFHTGHFGEHFHGLTPIGIFHNPNDFATFVATMIPFLFYAIYKSKYIILRLLYSMFFVFGLYLLVRSQSRATFLAVMIGLFFSSFMFFLISKPSCKLFILILVVLAVFFFVILNFQNNYLSHLNIITINSKGDSNRINLIKNGIEYLKQTHWLGIGAGNMKYWLQNRLVYYVGGIYYFHNWYLELLVSFGVFYFIVYIIFHCKILFKLFVNSIKNIKGFTLTSACSISFVLFSIVSIASSSNSYSEWVWMYYAFISSYSFNLRKPNFFISDYSSSSAFFSI